MMACKHSLRLKFQDYAWDIKISSACNSGFKVAAPPTITLPPIGEEIKQVFSYICVYYRYACMEDT